MAEAWICEMGVTYYHDCIWGPEIICSNGCIRKCAALAEVLLL
jgi:hypothetical protein